MTELPKVDITARVAIEAVKRKTVNSNIFPASCFLDSAWCLFLKTPVLHQCRVVQKVRSI